MDFETDKDNLLTYFGYLIKSFSKFRERTLSREKLSQELEALQKLKTSPQIKRRLKEIEKKMEDVIEKEKMILLSQKKEASSQFDVKKRVEILEKKLTKFLELQKTKQEGYKKIRLVQEKKKAISFLKKQIDETEKIYKQIRKAKECSKKDILKIEKRLKDLKEKLRKFS